MLTERLRLDPPRADDLDAYVAVFTHPEVSAWLRPDPEPAATRADIEAMIEGDIDLWRRLGFGPWAVFDRRDDAFLGRVGLQPRKLPDEEAIEVVWTIDPARHGEGLATEAALAAAELARRQGMQRVLRWCSRPTSPRGQSRRRPASWRAARSSTPGCRI